jgi:prepilin-type N-terminal cleavage/methylation domain-containing protein
MIEITTSNSTNVNELLFAFGNLLDEVIFITMTTPSLSSFRQNKKCSHYAFTLVELLAVITIIGILAGLTLGAAGAVRRHGATSTAKAEVAALQAACDRYFADNNSYPAPSTNSMPNPSLSSDVNPSPTSKYAIAGRSLFKELFGTNQYNLPPSTKRYFEPKPAMVSSTTNANPYLIDPWGYAYGYNSDGTNAPLIWSTAGQTTMAGTNKWITSWPKM